MKNIINLLYSIFIVLFSIILFLFPAEIFSACKYGLIFWYNNIVPSLFPFMIVSSLLVESKQLLTLLNKLLSKATRFLFGISGNGSIALFLGFFCGFPLGVKVTADLHNKSFISDIEANRLISFCNNCSPAFIINVVCLNLLGDITYAPMIIFIQLLSAISVGIVFKYLTREKNTKKTGEFLYDVNAPKSISKILSDSVVNSAYNSINIGGFIVFYSVLLQALNLSNAIQLLNTILLPFENLLGLDPLVQGRLIYGVFEISNGVNAIASSYGPLLEKLLLINIAINWGSFSVHSQALNIIQGTNISTKSYLGGKLLQSIFSIFYTILFFCF